MRILASMLLVAALGMAAAGLTAYLIQRERMLAQIDERLDATVAGLQTIATGDDQTPAPTGVDEFLELAMRRVLPAHNESTLGLIDGSPRYVPSSGIRFRLDDDPALVARLIAESQPDAVVRGTAEAQAGMLRYVIIPVAIQDDPRQGLYVSAFDLDAELAEITDAFGTYVIVAVGTLALVGLAGWFVSGRLLRPLRLLRRTAAAIGEDDLASRVPVSGSDDVSDLARSVNAMLDRLQRSFDAQRRLLDDVSHELRTPVTIVRGHLELLDATDPLDVDATRTLTIDELDRMNMLIDDIAFLVKTTRPDFLRRTAVDVAELTESVVAKAAALSPDHEWRAAGSAHVEINADPLRLTQAWLQLAENAAKYAPPGTVIEIGSVVTHDESPRVELWVRDRGSGVPQDQLDWIFDRFARVEVGRGVAGSGLGLSIVAAIASAHGGAAYARNPTGGGARVAIWLPLDRTSRIILTAPSSPTRKEAADAAHPGR
ncbi:cell wall metabolism sensor histidine kinase WalK [Salinibacterium sp. ZJ70]|uniref:sensor histidine kinase n=1 Tax=Salinibacterium sp. ZJ70 TaxID=2708084 RepID=UPI00141EEE72|nr:HAMP domain-containing sensor histidine kinase [Salinibacterium sp. ZJ70]